MSVIVIKFNPKLFTDMTLLLSQPGIIHNITKRTNRSLYSVLPGLENTMRKQNYCYLIDILGILNYYEPWRHDMTAWTDP